MSERKFLIAPSILSADFSKLGSEVREVQDAGADIIHVDVMDGHFVPNLTIGPMVAKALEKSTTLPLDVHLMVSRPEDMVLEFIEAGAAYVSFHIEATVHAHRLVQLIKEHGAKAGIALNPATSVSAIEELVGDVDMVVVMSVNPGFGGQRFIEAACDKLRRVRQMCDEAKKDIIVEIDGGVKTSNIKRIAEAGADMFVAGSAVFNSDDYKKTIEIMKSEVHSC